MSVCKVPIISRQKTIDYITNMIYINRHNMTKDYKNLKPDIWGHCFLYPKTGICLLVYIFLCLFCQKMSKGKIKVKFFLKLNLTIYFTSGGRTVYSYLSLCFNYINDRIQ